MRKTTRVKAPMIVPPSELSRANSTALHGAAMISANARLSGGDADADS
jgi:hypothetical protein